MRHPKSMVTVVLLCLVTASGPANAQPAKSDPSAGYPNRPVRLVVPVPPGGSSDAVARIMSQKLTDAWSHQVLVDNRTGAAEIIGTDIVAKANPDGLSKPPYPSRGIQAAVSKPRYPSRII